MKARNDDSPRGWGRGYPDMVRTFRADELPLPPIPAKLGSELLLKDLGCWATRPIIGIEMYEFDKYVSELFTERVRDYFAICHAGHGSNSWGLHLHLVYGPLAVFTQDSWGGLYMDPAECRRKIVETFALVAPLVEDVTRHAAASRRAARERVVIMWSGFRGHCAHARVPAVRWRRRWLRWRHRGPMSGMGWFPSEVNGKEVSWHHHDEKADLFEQARRDLAELLARSR